MISAALVLLLLADPETTRDEFELELHGGVLLTRFDDALGLRRAAVPGGEASLAWGTATADWLLNNRVFYRIWDDVAFDRYEHADIDLDGRIHALGYGVDFLANLGTPVLRAGFGTSMGVLRLEHDLDHEDSFFIELGPVLRLEPFVGGFVELGLSAHYAQTDFGEQEPDTDHMAWTSRVSVGVEVRF